MAEQPNTAPGRVGGCMLHNWAEERAVAALDTPETRSQIRKYGHRGILTTDWESKMERVTTLKATYVTPKSPGVRLRGVRGELLEKQLADTIREKIHAELNPPSPETDFCSTTQKDFGVEGFVPLAPETTQVHDYKSDQAVTFWSENRQRVQGVTGVQNPKASFRKSALFSTPIGERLDETEELPPDN
ncbi:sperm associated antigen 8 [Pseudoliparis swirei]|uniref:sperm associated antigen 8 n=1 Tax=Pseudoliparis swirei TaxID=2059687 RepID=UPI0024BE324E|nr:sperm associated antigen 8 [Pseudoliparis swirei]XP_056288065.1 sperm associated antigen 8 [Pseudoliparis swirei]XP_056288066.1 sperm associated antigen 8 [Pseudoliparis swirei]